MQKERKCGAKMEILLWLSAGGRERERQTGDREREFVWLVVPDRYDDEGLEKRAWKLIE